MSRVKQTVENEIQDQELVSCLRNEKVKVRYVMRPKGFIDNPKHIFYGNMAENASRWFTVPIDLNTRKFTRVLSLEEEKFLEELMGLKQGTLSPYKISLGEDINYWENYMVRLTKDEKYFDLSIPSDFIDYKVLLANSDTIAPSLEALKDRPKATYQYVIVSEQSELKEANKEMTASQEAWMNYGKIASSPDTMRYVVSIIKGKVVSPEVNEELLKPEVNKCIKENPKLFNDIVSDIFLESKVLLTTAVEKGVVSRRGDYYYFEGSPLSSGNDDPTLSIAAKFINQPKNQTLKLSLEAKMK